MKTKYLAIVALIALAGCSREGFNDISSRSLSATIDGSVESTKAILVDNPGVRMQSKWQGGDQIGVFGNGASNLQFSIDKADISDDGKTAKFNSGSDIPSGELYSYSPYQSGAASSSDAISLTFPSVQAYYLKDGVTQPDPSANIMMGSGSAATGIIFRNALAVLKIGQIFEASVLLKSVVFRDLSGAAVSGAMTLTWNGGKPIAEITGSGSSISLNLGDGIALDAGELGTFFMIVPARSYPNGFEISFVEEGGNKTVKTIGTTQGKTLDRSVVYSIGDIAPRQYVEGASSQLKSTAQIMTAEKMDKVRVTSTFMTSVVDENGKEYFDCNGKHIIMPRYGMMVHKDLNPVEGGWMVFEDATDDLPKGGVYKIVSCRKSNDDYYEVVAYPDVNPTSAFESIEAGKPMVDASGTIVEENGLPLDITSYVKSIVDESGNELYYSTRSSGELIIGMEEMKAALDAATKAYKPHSRTFKSPKLSANVKSENSELAIGATMTFNTRLALGVMQGSLQYAYLTVNPLITISQSLTVKSEVNLQKSLRLFTLTTHPILIAPGVAVYVEIVFYASLGVGGNLQITASVESTTDLGTYSVSYNDGDGVIFRNKPMAKEVPGSFNGDLSGIEGSVYASGSIGAKTSISVWGVFGLGVSTDFILKCGLFSSEGGGKSWKKLALQPEIEFTPILSTFLCSYKFEELTTKVELDPIWEKYVIPPTRTGYVNPKYNYTENRLTIKYGDKSLDTYVPTGVKGIDYSISIEGECFETLKVVLLVFTGTGIKIKPQDPSDPNGEELAAMRASGIEHLYSQIYMCDKSLQGISEEPVQILEIGSYPTGSESQTFEGTATGSFSQGQAYGVVPAISVGDSYYIIDRGSSAYYFNPLIYWWPNRSNGAPY